MFKPHHPDQIGDTIARLWIFTFFVILFRDIHEMAVASTIEGVLQGTLEGRPVTDAGLVAGGVALLLMLLTGLLSPLLVRRVARWLNLTVAPLALLGSLYAFPNDPDDYLLGGATALSLVAIFGLAWTWVPVHRDIDGRSSLPGLGRSMTL